jgi:hypothetical protein
MAIEWMSKNELLAKYHEGWVGAAYKTPHKIPRPAVDVRRYGSRGSSGSIRIFVCKSHEHPKMGKRYIRKVLRGDIQRDQIMVSVTTSGTVNFPVSIASEIGTIVDEAVREFIGMILVRDLESTKW